VNRARNDFTSSAARLARQIEALRKRLADNGVSASTVMTNSFGARGLAPEAFYFRDPDNNVIEARFYE
jgi:glyoxylase I family protein